MQISTSQTLVSAVVCHLCVRLPLSPMRPFHTACGFVCQIPNRHTLTDTRSIGVQSGKGLSVVLCEWPLLKQINRRWHVPPPSKRKQLKAIDPVPGFPMNMHVSLTFPWRGEGKRGRERETNRLTDRCRSALFFRPSVVMLAALRLCFATPQIYCSANSNMPRKLT